MAERIAGDDTVEGRVAPTPRSPASRGTRGSVAVGGPAGHRRRGAWLLLPLLALLALIALVVYLLAHHSTSSHTTSPAATATTATAAPGGAQAEAGASGGQAAAGATGAQGAAAGALVGGGGVTATAASGQLAAQGVIGDVLFTESGTTLDSAAQQVIANAATVIRADGAKHVAVIGYTDANGDANANVTLSQQRAQVVEQALQQQLGGVPVQLSAAAQGQSQPVASNATPQGQQLNRRVAITIAG